MSTTRLTQHIAAPRARVYRALIDGAQVATWMVPTGMTSHVHAFAGVEGGAFRISLTYDAPTGTGKSSAHTDTFHGRFVELLRDRKVVETVEFETDQPAMQGPMTITYELEDGPDGDTVLYARHDDVPPGVSPADNELGWRISLGRLKALVEATE